MRKIILFSAVSIDGYIAGEGDDLDWLTTFGASDTRAEEDYETFLSKVDTALMGNGTYKFVVHEGIVDPYPDMATYVFTRRPKAPTDAVTYITKDIVGFAKGLKEQEGKDIWLVGGGVINALFLKNKLIDELWLDIIPVTLEKGIRLFEGEGSFQQFAVAETKVSPQGRVTIKYVKNELAQ